MSNSIFFVIQDADVAVNLATVFFFLFVILLFLGNTNV